MTLTQWAEIASIVSCLVSIVALVISGVTMAFTININKSISKDKTNIIEKTKIKDSKIDMINR